MDHLLYEEEYKKKKCQNFLYFGKFSLLSLRIFVEKRKKQSTDQMKTSTSERCDTHILDHSVKSIIPKIITNNNQNQHNEATKKIDTEQTIT